MKNEFIIKDRYAEIIINSPKYGIEKALIDVEDIEKVDKYKWHLSGLKKKGNHYIEAYPNKRLHRYILDCPDGMVVDHINRNTLDNRRENLRLCTQCDNLKNRALNSNNKTGIVGVCWHKRDKKFVARIWVNYKCITLYSGNSLDEAIKARKDGR